MSASEKKSRRRFTPEFKAQAVKRVLAGGQQRQPLLGVAVQDLELSSRVPAASLCRLNGGAPLVGNGLSELVQPTTTNIDTVPSASSPRRNAMPAWTPCSSKNARRSMRPLEPDIRNAGGGLFGIGSGSKSFT